MPVIEIANLTKDYQVGFFGKRTVRALDDLSEQLPRAHGHRLDRLSAARRVAVAAQRLPPRRPARRHRHIEQ